MGPPRHTSNRRALPALITAVVVAAALCVATVRAAIGVGEGRTTFGGSIKEITATAGSIVAAGNKPAITRRLLRSTESAERIDFSVALKMRDFSELEGRVARGERIARAEMERRYWPRAADYDATVAWLKSQGFTLGKPDPSRSVIYASGTIEQARRAFQVEFGRVAFAGEEHTSALTVPSLPTAIAGPILGINGLQQHVRAHKHAIAPRPADATSNNPPYFPSQIATAYNALPATLGVNGAGQTIGIVIDTFPLNSDLTSFWTLCNVPQTLSNIQEVQVVSGTSTDSSAEVTLDVEWASSIAPAAKVRVYATLDLSLTHIDQAYTQIFQEVTSGAVQNLNQISMSFGIGETFEPDSQLLTDAQLLANLASVGVTAFAASGDAGSNPDAGGGETGPTQVEAPASVPTVIAVGGTTLNLDQTTGAISNEVVWNSGANATGGGISGFFTRESWQVGTGVLAGGFRAVPDVASAADPGTGAEVFLNGISQLFGGTSWSSPTWAGFCALINQARANASQPALGLLGPKLYPLLGTAAFHDITSGSNGAFSAGVGYDACSGLGTPNVAVLLQALNGQPSIVTQPATLGVAPGQNASFAVVASTTTTGGALIYQWQREAAGTSGFVNLTNAGPYEGVTTPTLSVTATTLAMNGDQFTCTVSNSIGSIVTLPAILEVGELTVTTFAGQAGITGSSNGTGSSALFNTPGGIAADAAGNIYVADTVNDTVRKVTPAGVVTTLAGRAGIAGSTNNNIGSHARFNSTSNVAVDSAGNVYVADAGNSEIRKITSAGVVTTLAGSAGVTGSTDGTGSNARFNVPQGLTVDAAGNVYVADTNNNTIRKITPAGVVTTFAGTAGNTGSADGTGPTASFNFPVDITIDANGNLYVADTNNAIIRKITTPGAVVSTYAGTAGAIGSADGVGAAARFNTPAGVRTDAAGNLYVTDTTNNTIRLITPDGTVTTFAGQTGVAGSADGTGPDATFNSPSDALPDGLGHIYIIDTGNDTLRIAQAIVAPQFQVSPTNQIGLAGQTANFAVAVTVIPSTAFRWQREAAGASSFVNLTDGGGFSGTATAILAVSPLTLGESGDQYQCVATNAFGTATSSPATLTVATLPQFTGATTGEFYVGQAVNFSVTATGTPVPVLNANGLPPGLGFDPVAGAVSGTPTAAGTFTAAFTATNIGGSATESFTFTVEVLEPFVAWAAAVPLTGEAADPLADPNNTGLANLIKYAFALDPLNPNVQQLPQISVVNDSNGISRSQIVFTIPATAPNVIYTVQVSGDLINWTDGNAYGPGAVNGTGLPTVQIAAVIHGDGSQSVTVQDQGGAAGVTRFIRVLVTQP